MKAISMWQPWATAVALRAKRIETRHWQTKYRGPLAIHASKRWWLEEREFALELAPLLAQQTTAPVLFPLGAIVATVELVGVRFTEDIADRIGPLERMLGNYAAGRFGWIFENVRPLREPIPYKGHQGFFNVPDELLANA